MARTQARVDIRILPVAALTAKEWDGIWELTQIYVGTRRPFYEAKLRAFPEVALFRNRSGALVGIVALDVYRADFRSETSTIPFTSSVVIDEPYRRHNLIQRTGFRVFLRARLRHPFRPIYWFFDTFSYKSYGLLPGHQEGDMLVCLCPLTLKNWLYAA